MATAGVLNAFNCPDLNSADPHFFISNYVDELDIGADSDDTTTTLLTVAVTASTAGTTAVAAFFLFLVPLVTAILEFIY